MTYEVGLGESGTVHLCVAANEGGGYFSSEWVSLPRILEVLADFLSSGGSFPTHALLPAFNNRSVNNAGFLAAILRHEGLLKAGDKPHSHACCGDWEAWQAAQRDAQRLAEAGASITGNDDGDSGVEEGDNATDEVGNGGEGDYFAMAAESGEDGQDAGNEIEAFDESMDVLKIETFAEGPVDAREADTVVVEDADIAHQQGTHEAAGQPPRKGKAEKRPQGRDHHAQA